MRLSQNFTLAEMIKSQTAERKAINNNPNEDNIENLQRLCEHVLQPVREHYGKVVSVSSGFRSPELCVAIGSSTTSQHASGQAADFEIYGVSNKELADYIADNLDFDQLILEHFDNSDPSSGWVHVSVVSPESRKYNRHDTLVYDGKSYSRGLPG